MTPRERAEWERSEAEARDGVGLIGGCLIIAALLLVFL